MRHVAEHWHIMDCGLRAESGHHHWVCAALAGELTRRGRAFTLYGHREAPPDLIDGTRVVPFFRVGYYASQAMEEAWGPIEELIVHNRAFARDLGQLDPASVAGQVIVFPTISIAQLMGITHWVRQLGANAPRKLVLYLMHPPGRVLGGLPLPHAEYFWSRLRDDWTPDLLDRFVPCTESDALVGRFERFLKMRLPVLPHYMDGWRDEASPTTPGAGPRIAYLGHARPDKGVHLLPGLLNRCHAHAPDATFFIQLHPATDELVAEVGTYLVDRSYVTLHRGSLDRDAYYGALQESDLALLPYNPERYNFNFSAVYLEAGLAGTPVVVPEGTWMADEVRAGGHGTIFPEQKSGPIAAAVAEALARLPELKARASARATQLRPAHGPKAFVDRIESLVGEVAPGAMTPGHGMAGATAGRPA